MFIKSWLWNLFSFLNYLIYINIEYFKLHRINICSFAYVKPHKINTAELKSTHWETLINPLITFLCLQQFPHQSIRHPRNCLRGQVQLPLLRATIRRPRGIVQINWARIESPLEGITHTSRRLYNPRGHPFNNDEATNTLYKIKWSRVNICTPYIYIINQMQLCSAHDRRKFP